VEPVPESTGGARCAVTQLRPLIDGVGPVGGKRGRPLQRPDRLLAARDYDHDKYRRLLWQRGVKPVIARRGDDHGSGLGTERWVVERTFAWLHNALDAQPSQHLDLDLQPRPRHQGGSLRRF
jgi:transposase